MKRLISIGLCIAVIITIIWHMGLSDCFSLTTMQQKSDYFTFLVKNHYIWASFIYLLVYIGGIFLGLPIVIPLTMLGGYLFGLWNGVLYALIGATMGSTAYFLLIRYTLSTTDTAKYTHHIATFKKLIHTYGPNYLLFVHFITVIPYVVINTSAALVPVPLGTFVWTTALGALPGMFLYNFAGRQLRNISSLCDILEPKFFFIFLILASLTIIPIIINKRKINSLIK